MTAKEVIEYMESLQDEVQRVNLMRFFKTGKGQYGYGDEFLGLKVPVTRRVVKQAYDIPLGEIPELLMSKWHEVRLCGFLLLVAKFEANAKKKQENEPSAIKVRDEIVLLYLKHAKQANNWDLVDMSAPKIIGKWLLLPTFLGGKQKEASLNQDYKLNVLDKLADSSCLWEQRISMVCSWMTSRHGEPNYCLRYAEKHIYHQHDLMHKAVGWMLREMGKQNIDLLREFLEHYAHTMPRTALRYAIERMSETERQLWLKY